MKLISILAAWLPISAIRGTALGVIAILLATLPLTHAASTEPVSQTFAFRPTDWNESVDLPLFDSALGTLTGIVFELEGSVGGSIAYESQDGSPQTITMTLGSELNVEAPAGLIGVTDLVTTLPSIEIIEDASAFDGTLDFAGSSGSTFTDLESSATQLATYDDNNPLWEFSIREFFTTDTAGSTVALPITAVANSSGSGSGNLSLNFQTSAGGQLTVTYLYAPIPEPGTLTLIASGLLLGARRRPKR